MGPSAGVADVRADGATVWGASQSIYGTRATVAGLLGMPQDKVKIIFAEGAGCYGRNLQDDAACAAALMSQLAGKPVRVQLTRDQEHGWEFYGPATLVDIRGAVDADPDLIHHWYITRFMRLRETAFQDPLSYFRRYAVLSESEAVAEAERTIDKLLEVAPNRAGIDAAGCAVTALRTAGPGFADAKRPAAKHWKPTPMLLRM